MHGCYLSMQSLLVFPVGNGRQFMYRRRGERFRVFTCGVLVGKVASWPKMTNEDKIYKCTWLLSDVVCFEISEGEKNPSTSTEALHRLLLPLVLNGSSMGIDYNFVQHRTTMDQAPRCY